MYCILELKRKGRNLSFVQSHLIYHLLNILAVYNRKERELYTYCALLFT